MDAIGYCRVSTAGQVQDGVSLDAQRGKIEAWAKASGYPLAAVEVDAGLSGGKAANRPGLQAAIALACKSKGVLVVYSLSRLARSTKDAIFISEKLDKSGADLVSLSEKLDTTSAAGKMVFRMFAVLAEFERDLVSERTSTALQHMKAEGKRVGTIPFGFDLAPDAVKLVENPKEQKEIAVIHALREKGLSFRKIAAQLEPRGIRTKSGGTAWTPQAIKNVLSRKVAAHA